MNTTTEQTRQETAHQLSFEETLLSARRTMLLSEILKLAADSFRAAKMRFVLTALGMVIGTASVILVVTIGMTGREYVLDLIQKFGTNSVEVEYAGGGATAQERVRYTDYLTVAVPRQPPLRWILGPAITQPGPEGPWRHRRPPRREYGRA